MAERRETVGALLERFGLWEVRHQHVGSFSRGMQQRLAFCRVLLHGPELLLFDEPYSGLDASARTLVDDVLAEAAGARTLVVASHEPEHVRPLATQALALA